MDDAGRVAAGLSEAQRRAVRDASSLFGGSKARLYHAGRGGTGRALFRLGLVTFNGVLNDEGLAVRAELMKDRAP